MIRHGTARTVALLVSAAFSASCGKTNSSATPTSPTANVENVVNLYIWSDYLAPNTLADFTRNTGIKINVTYFDTFAVPEARLLGGRTGFDVVVVAPHFSGA